MELTDELGHLTSVGIICLITGLIACAQLAGEIILALIRNSLSPRVRWTIVNENEYEYEYE